MRKRLASLVVAGGATGMLWMGLAGPAQSATCQPQSGSADDVTTGTEDTGVYAYTNDTDPTNGYIGVSFPDGYAEAAGDAETQSGHIVVAGSSEAGSGGITTDGDGGQPGTCEL